MFQSVRFGYLTAAFKTILSHRIHVDLLFVLCPDCKPCEYSALQQQSLASMINWSEFCVSVGGGRKGNRVGGTHIYTNILSVSASLKHTDCAVHVIRTS